MRWTIPWAGLLALGLLAACGSREGPGAAKGAADPGSPQEKPWKEGDPPRPGPDGVPSPVAPTPPGFKGDPRSCPLYDGRPGRPRGAAETLATLQRVGEADRVRREQIAKCAACHPAQYESWKRDSHADSYNAVVMTYKGILDPKSLASPEARNERDFREGDGRATCGSCHLPTRNLYEAALSPEWNGTDPIRVDHRKMCLFPEDETVTTGVDCIICHVRGDRVVTRGDYVPSPALAESRAKGGCNPLASKTVPHLYNCLMCHAQADGYLDRYVAGGGKEYPYVHCDECHREKGPDGKYTHLWYWSDHRDKLDKVVAPAMRKVAYEVRRGADGKPELAVTWHHDFAPHPLVPETPRMYLLQFEVLDPRGQVLHRADARFYSRDEDPDHDTLVKYNPGAGLFTLAPGETFRQAYPLPASVGRRGSIRFTALQKRLFDFPDSEVSVILQREVPFRL